MLSPGKHTISSAELPSHKTRWSAEEDEKLRKALVSLNCVLRYLCGFRFEFSMNLQEQFGYGNWKAVSESVGSRNPLQCKNHARHLVNSSKVSHSVQKTNFINFYG